MSIYKGEEVLRLLEKRSRTVALDSDPDKENFPAGSRSRRSEFDNGSSGVSAAPAGVNSCKHLSPQREHAHAGGNLSPRVDRHRAFSYFASSTSVCYETRAGFAAVGGRPPSEKARSIAGKIGSPTPAAPDKARAEQRVLSSVFERRLGMLAQDEERVRMYTALDERHGRAEAEAEERRERRMAGAAGELNGLYVECVRTTVLILNEESEERDEFRRLLDKLRAEEALQCATRDEREGEEATDIVKKACHAAKMVWVARRLDEALTLVQEHRAELAAVAVSPGPTLAERKAAELAQARSSEDAMQMAMRAFDALPEMRQPQQRIVSPMRAVDPKSRPTDVNFPLERLTEDDGLRAIMEYRIAQSFGSVAGSPGGAAQTTPQISGEEETPQPFSTSDQLPSVRIES